MSSFRNRRRESSEYTRHGTAAKRHRRENSDYKDRDRRRERDRRDRRDDRDKDRRGRTRERNRREPVQRRDNDHNDRRRDVEVPVAVEESSVVEETAEEIAAKEKQIEAELQNFEEVEDEEAVAERRRLERVRRREAIMRRHKDTVASKAKPATKASLSTPKQPPAVAAATQVSGKDAETHDKEGTQDTSKPKPEEDDFDMFSLDKFSALKSVGTGDDKHEEIEQNSTLADNWDDKEGYYRERVGEKLYEGRYHVLGGRGKGVFSTVLLCRNTRRQGKIQHEHVAVKVIRANDLMRKEGMKELTILREIGQADPHGTSHNVRILEHFVHRNHLCLVFEAAEMNLREVIKKYGRNSGINIDAVRRYAKQLFQALRLLKKLGIIHADLKPDNIIVSADNHNIQVCDFGSAFRENGPDVIPTPYLVSRFYRAPEIILGDLYGCAIDVWAAATCLYELFTGSVMFSGRDNNAMLHEMQLIKGAFPVKILRRHRTNYEKLEKDHHFVQMPDWRFKLNKIDRVTKRIITSYIVVTTPKKDLGKVLMSSLSASGKKKLVLQLKDLLMKCLALDPDKRVTPSQALKHPFISSKTIHR